MNIEGRLDHGKTDPVYRVYSGSRLVFSTHRSPLFTHQDDRERDPRIIYVEREEARVATTDEEKEKGG